MADLIERIHPEKRWAITAKTLLRFLVMQGSKIFAPTLGKGEGITSPVLGAEKWTEIIMKIYSDGAKFMFPWVKERFNIPVEDAIGADNLLTVVSVLQNGPEMETEIVEATPERVVSRVTKCAWWERYKELEVDHTLRTCDAVDQLWGEEGFKAINPKITYRLTKAIPRGNPYCEFVYEFKEE
jgi:hypothetical protein